MPLPLQYRQRDGSPFSQHAMVMLANAFEPISAQRPNCLRRPAPRLRTSRSVFILLHGILIHGFDWASGFRFYDHHRDGVAAREKRQENEDEVFHRLTSTQTQHSA